MNQRWLQAAGVLLVAALVIAALVSRALSIVRSEDEVWARVRETGVLMVATDASYPPFEALDEKGEFVGFDVDLAEEVGRRLGLRVAYENIAYDGLLGTLVVRRSDVVISAFVPQPQREADVSYTRPYFNAGTVVVSRSDSTFSAGSAGREGAWARGRVVAVEYGSNSDALARRWTRLYPDVTLDNYPTAGEAMLAVGEGQADAAVVDAVSAYEFLQGYPGLVIADSPLEDEFYAMAVNVHSTRLLAALNEALAAMEADGTLPELRVKWFGEAAR